MVGGRNKVEMSNVFTKNNSWTWERRLNLRLNKEYLQYAANPTAIKPRSASTTSSSLATVRPSIVPSLKTELTVLR